MAHSDDDVPLVEAGVDLPEASRRLVLVRGSCGENSHSLPDMTAPDQRVGLPPSVSDTVPASSAAVRRLVLVQSHVGSEEVGTAMVDDVDVGEPSARAPERPPQPCG